MFLKKLQKKSSEESSEIVNLRLAANQGDVQAQYKLGVIYAEGTGVSKDDKQAVAWYQKAAQQNHLGAQTNLGHMYEECRGVVRDYAQAFTWYEKAAQHNDALAQARLGRLYKKGYGVARNYAKAIELFRQSAEQGCAEGQYYLSVMYKRGFGVDINEELANSWCLKAAEQDLPKACYTLGNFYSNTKTQANGKEKGDSWRRKALVGYQKLASRGELKAQKKLGSMYTCGVTKDEKEAAMWNRKALAGYQQLASQGDAIAHYCVGDLCFYGRVGIPENGKQALLCFQKSANLGYAKAHSQLGRIYDSYSRSQRCGLKDEDRQRGAITHYQKAADGGYSDAMWRVAYHWEAQKNYSKAMGWYLKSAEQSNECTSQNKLGEFYEKGKGVSINYELAFNWYHNAAKQNNANGQYNLARMYYFGYGINKNYEQAIIWYRKAAEQEYGEAHAKAFNALGEMYANGQGVPKDDEQAVKYYRQAAEKTSLASDAQYNLGCMYEKGHGVNQDYSQAVYWFDKSSIRLPAAKYKLGLMYENGWGVDKNEKTALSHYDSAARDGNIDAMCSMGMMHQYGRGTPQNYKTALSYYQQAADRGHANAEFHLGEIYENGNGVPKNFTTALNWYQKAAKQGHEAAKNKIATLEKIPQPKISFLPENKTKLEKENERKAREAQVLERQRLEQEHKALEALQQYKKSEKEETELHANTDVTLSSSQSSLNSEAINISDSLMGLRLTVITENTEDKNRPIKGDFLGQGGYGTVYKGKWRGCDVAIKELNTKELNQEELEEFMHESNVMAGLIGKHIVSLYAITLKPYSMIMEYMVNGSLYNLLRSDKELTWNLRIRMALEIIKGLIFLHNSGFYHRDLKSLNILLDEDFHAKLADFGLAKVRKNSSIVSTTTQQTVGTLAWIAPELFVPKATYTKKSEMYSYGMVLWELASRKIPYEEAYHPTIIPVWVQQGHRETIPTDTPPLLANIIKQCWAQDPQQRPKAKQVLAWLEEKSTDLNSKSEIKISSPKMETVGDPINDYQLFSDKKIDVNSQLESGYIQNNQP